jgi:hypothetical protein
VIDASYGGNDSILSAESDALTAFVDGHPALFPVPADGRGPEIALAFARSGRTDFHLDEATLSAFRRLAGEQAASVQDGLAPELNAIAAQSKPIVDPNGLMLATSADGTRGDSARLLAQWEHGSEPMIVFTGYVPPGTPADRLIASGRAKLLRWNVHPRLTDNVALVRFVAANLVVPAFCEPTEFAALSSALAPARLITETPVSV